jgi:sterol desaturase/sphingolipid hydroxylase (fatty acid hydroxylase superfamily)
MISIESIGVAAFCTLVPLELYVGIRRDLRLYGRGDTAANLVLGALTGATKLVTKAAALLAFTLVHRWALFDIPADSALWFGVLLLLNDAAFYGWHRLSHETRLLWAFHEAHHNSRYLNVTTAIRGNFVQHAFRWMFWTPLALLGFDPLLIVVADQVAYTYQLYLHTDLIPRLGPLEWVMNTPSHHRVHHSRVPRHLDQNYGAIFIVWDRLFGSFTPETEPVVYGGSGAIDGNDPVEIAFREIRGLARAFREQPMTLGQKLRYLWTRPGPRFPAAAPGSSLSSAVGT